MTLRLSVKSASNVPLPEPETTCTMTFRKDWRDTTTFKQKVNPNNPAWDELFEWALTSAPTAEEVIEVSIVYESSSAGEKATATAIIPLDSILGKDASKGEPLVVPTQTRHGDPLDMKLHVHLAYWAIDYNDLKQDKEQLEKDKERLEKDKERLEKVKEQLEQDKGRLEQEKGRLEQDKGQLEQVKKQLEQENARLRREADKWCRWL